MEGKLTGTIHEGEFISKIFDKAVFRYVVHIPQSCEGREDCALLVSHDGSYEVEAGSLEILAATDEAPCCVTVAVFPGRLHATIDGGFTRNLRLNNYDIYGKRYPDFIVDELMPWLIEKYDLSISASPDMHMVCGASSGGISSWNIAWRRNDYFRRVYMGSPSFLEMARGQELVTLMRKCETKPIRVFTEFSETEPDDYFGSSYCVADAAERALRFAGYDMEARFYPGLGHSGNYRNLEVSLERMRFLWKNWRTEPVKVTRFSPRVEKVVSVDCPWEETDAAFPERVRAVSDGRFTAKGTYTADGNRILFGGNAFAPEELEDVSCLEISSDKWRLYIGDRRRGCVYAASIEPDGSLGGLYIHGVLHHDTEFRYPGALDMCIDHEDRLYVATELGIQLIRSFGLIDVILENPDGLQVDRLEIGTDGYLYAQAGGKTYRRKLNEKYPANICAQTEPKNIGYYD